MTLTINDIADVINISVSNPAESGYDVFVGLEHYDIGEPVITRYGSTKMLTTACKKFSAGDILLARRNVYLRRAGIVEFDGLTSGDSIVIRVKTNLSIEGVDSNAISRLLPFILNTNAFWDFANTNSDGTMSKRLSPQMLLSYEFELPPVAQQRPLADKLWAAYKLKASKLKLIEAIDEMVKSQFIEMFGSPFEDNRNWPSQKLCNLGVLARGVSKARPRNSPDLIGGPYPLVQTGEVANCETYITSHESSYSEKGLAQSKMWPTGTLCITIAANIAKTGILTFDACFPDSVVGFIPNKDINILFIHHWFCSIQKELERQAPSTAQKNFNLEKLSNLQINVPPMSLQVRFADIVKQADKSKFELKKSIEKIDNVIKALMQ